MYELIVSKQAEKYINKQDAPIRRLHAALLTLVDNPRTVGERLINHDTEYKLRVGKFRILYNVYDQQVTVAVVKVYNRGDVYKN